MGRQSEFSRAFEELLEELESTGEKGTKSLLLHSCCAPCSSACLERLREYFRVTVFYYNPNIDDAPEYEKRYAEQKRLIEALNQTGGQKIELYSMEKVQGEDHDSGLFLQAVKGMEDLPEGGDRCSVCFALRLSKTAQIAAAEGFDYCTTTLTISPLKDAVRLNNIGEDRARCEGTCWLPSDFKKKNGYKRSVELSEQYDLYRQNYCGCSFSRKEAEEREKSRAEKIEQG